MFGDQSSMILARVVPPDMIFFKPNFIMTYRHQNYNYIFYLIIEDIYRNAAAI